MFDLDRETEQAQQREGAWTVPAEAGGADPWADGPVNAMCILAGIDPTTLASKDRRSWARQLHKIADDNSEFVAITPQVMVDAIQAIPESDIGWKASNYKSPFKDGFIEDIRPLLLNGGKPTGQKSSQLKVPQQSILTEYPISVEVEH